MQFNAIECNLMHPNAS